MFNEDEVNFIEETARKDLKSLDMKIESIVGDMARLGKNLGDLKVVQSRLNSILKAIAEEREEHCQGAC